MAESVSVDVLAKVYGTRDVSKLGDEFAKTAVTADAAAVSLKVWNDTAAKSAKADATLVASRNAHAKADKLLADAENVLAGKSTQYTRLLADQRAKTDEAAKSAEGAVGRFSALAGTGGIAGGGMGAAIAAGVALSPVLLTVGTGLGGLAAAAYGVAKPIENAAQKTGGLRANLKLLDPEQRKVAQGILSLGSAYGHFQQSLKPEVLGVFNAGLRIAGHLLHDVQPVAQATGKALDQVLLSVDREFQSGTWQQFFQFMAKNAGPDTLLLGKTLTDVLQVIPPLTQDLQPLAHAILITGDDAAKAAGGVVKFYDSFQRDVPFSNLHVGNALKDLDAWTVRLTDHLGPWARAINNSGTALQHAAGDASSPAAKAAQHVRDVTQAASGAGDAFTGLTTRTVAVATPMDHLGKTSQTTSVTMTEVSSKAILVSSSYDHLAKVADVVSNGQQTFAQKLAASAQAAKLDAAANATVAKELNILAAAQEHALTPLENYINANIAEANQLHTLKQDLRASGDAIGYKTQKERTSFSDAQTYIDYTLKQGNAALAAHKGIDQQIASIEHALPVLENVKGKTSAYKQELDLLKGILDKLRAEKLIDEKVHVTGSGNWSLTRIGAGPLSSKPLAAGGRVPGTGNSDSFPAMLTPGEVVVPKGMVSAGAVDHLRGKLPGFASGGIVPSYGGPVAGLPPWTSRNQQATVTAIGVDIAKAMAASFKAAVQAARTASAPGALGGPTSASAAQAQAYARSRLGAYGWSSGQMPSLISLWNQESSWNRFARNPSSGAYGIPQALPASKMGPAANPPTSSAAAQINWGLGYIKGRYGSPYAAESHEISFGWYDRGGPLPPGLSLAYNGTGRPEQVIPGRGAPATHVVLEIAPGGEGALTAALMQVLRKQIRVRGGGDVQLALGRL